MYIVKETKSKIIGIVPQVASELDDVNNMLGDLTYEAGEVNSTSLPIEATDSEARKILEETGLMAEERVREHFPDLSSIETQPTRKPEAIPELATAIPDMEVSIEERIYDYARRHNGELSIKSCASEIGKSPEEVRVTLQRLQESGKVAIQ
jgi:hypothetical protein